MLPSSHQACIVIVSSSFICPQFTLQNENLEIFKHITTRSPHHLNIELLGFFFLFKSWINLNKFRGQFKGGVLESEVLGRAGEDESVVDVDEVSGVI